MQFGGEMRIVSVLLIGSLLLMGLVLVHGEDHSSKDSPHVRHKRGIIWDFFQKMVITKNLLVDVSSWSCETYNN